MVQIRDHFKFNKQKTSILNRFYRLHSHKRANLGGFLLSFPNRFGDHASLNHLQPMDRDLFISLVYLGVMGWATYYVDCMQQFTHEA